MKMIKSVCPGCGQEDLFCRKVVSEFVDFTCGGCGGKLNPKTTGPSRTASKPDGDMETRGKGNT